MTELKRGDGVRAAETKQPSYDPASLHVATNLLTGEQVSVAIPDPPVRKVEGDPVKAAKQAAKQAVKNLSGQHIPRPCTEKGPPATGA